MGHRLTRIYTRGGDDGSTSLGDGSRAGKDGPRIQAFGELDELNCQIGLLRAQRPEYTERDALWDSLGEIQHLLFDIGGDLCIPGRLSIRQKDVDWLESWIDHLNAELPPLKEFLLPGGGIPAATCHAARAVCRRAERAVVALARIERVEPVILAFLNRLSDLLFVIARVIALDAGELETLWQPHRQRPAPPH